jgi:anionic cell wall polymer biosynthesis LytR-Cps2A-Psr (LCP) family protein
MQRQRCAINAIVEEASPVKMLKRYTKLAATSKEIVRTDIPAKLLPAFVDLAGKVKDKPIKSVGFELSDEFNPNDPDFDYVRAAVQAALRPASATQPGTGTTPAGTPATPSSGSTATATSGSTATAEPSKATDAAEACAYQPTTTTIATSQ